MEKNRHDTELEELIRSSMDTADIPSMELNSRLKTALYQKENVMHRQALTKSISLWYLPMILNFVTFGLLAVIALLVIANPYLSKIAAAICLYIGFAGFFITALGMKRTKLKEDIVIIIEKRGVVA